MKKRAWLLLSILAITIFCSVIIIMKPDQADFAKWMENTYEIKCLSYNCHSFQLDGKDSEEPIIMQSIRGGYSPGIFVSRVYYSYRNLEDPSYILNMEVEGFFRGFYIKEETIKNIERK